MTTERYPNRYAVSHGLDNYRDAMRDFITRGLRTLPGRPLEDAVRVALPVKAALEFDSAVSNGGMLVRDAIEERHFPPIVKRYWTDVFRARVGDGDVKRGFVSLLWDVKEYRNLVAHPRSGRDMDADTAQEALRAIVQALESIKAASAAQETGNILQGLRNAGAVTARAATDSDSPDRTAPIAGENRGRQSSRTRTPANQETQSRKPWREVIRPSHDVIEGNLDPSDFAANLQAVYDGEADESLYGNPVAFFRRTYLTDGIRQLLRATMQRLAGNGGYAVVQAKTGFGGGKTHSLIALYHLVTSGSFLVDAPGNGRGDEVLEQIRTIMEEAGYSPDQDKAACVSVLNGYQLSPTDTWTTENGDPLNTLWGVMAYQLGGAEGYNLIAGAAREWTAPGSGQLRALFDYVGPCVILMDEIVNYARNFSGDHRIERVYTFFQNLTEAVRQQNNVALVVSLPESEAEAGDEQGAEMLRRIEIILGRVEAVWRPVEDSEGFEVVRRRLFRDETCNADDRDRTCHAYNEMYRRRNNRTKFPNEATREQYEERIRDCYPIHPELFNRLIDGWSIHHNFQRTRGALRIMALCINRLYHSDDASPIIMPGDIPFADPELSGEFTRLLGANWNPVLDEVGKDGSRADVIDGQRSDFRDIRPARRMLRTIFLGSAPALLNPGLDTRQIYLGAISLGHPISAYDEAIRRMDGEFYHLYRENNRYHFSSDVNLSLLAKERRGEFGIEDDDDEIMRRISENCASMPPGIVALCPADSAEVPDTDQLCVVVLRPDQVRGPRDREADKATPAARHLTQDYDGAPRHNRNRLLFLSVSTDRVRSLRESARNILVWDSIVNGERRVAHLSKQRQDEAHENLQNAGRDFNRALVYGYSYSAVPLPYDTDGYRFEWETKRFPQDSVIANNINAVIDDAAVSRFDPRTLSDLLDKQIWRSRADSYQISIAELWAIFAQDVTMPRLRDRTVLEDCIAQGVADGLFGFAQGYDAETDAYEGLHFQGRTLNAGGIAEGMSIEVSDAGLLVQPTAVDFHFQQAQSMVAANLPHYEPDRAELLVPPPAENASDSPVADASLVERSETTRASCETEPEASAMASNPPDHHQSNAGDAYEPAAGPVAAGVATALAPANDTITEVRLRFTITNRREANEARPIGNQYADDLRADGGQITITMSVTAVQEVDGMPYPRALFDDAGIPDINVFHGRDGLVFTITIVGQNLSGISPHIIHDMRESAHGRSFIAIDVQ